MDHQTVLKLYEMMFLIRSVEERIVQEYPSRNIRMAVHLSIGQEAIPTGILLAGRKSDCCVSTHRSHAHYLAKGGDLAEMIDELYSLETGCCHGRGGSMHLFDKKVNLWGSGAIVAGGVPIATGMALALKQQATDDICIGFTGDGGTDEGAFYESLNLVALLNLPLLFVVENNGYSVLTPQAKRQANPDAVAKARSFGVESISVDGNDVLKVYETARQAINEMRRSGQPFLLEAITYRLYPHVGSGSDFGNGGRPQEELLVWMEKEPIQRLKLKIRNQYSDLEPRCAQIEEQVVERINKAFESAKTRFAIKNAEVGLAAPKPPDPSRV
jgi:TPP-dependent pyruvate/acetoin dehydrogenase alpha subunit